MATSQDFVNGVATSSVLPDWVKVAFMADRDALIRFGKGAIHITIYFPEWMSMHIALPPLAEQRRIVGEVNRRLFQLEQIDKQITAALERSAQLRPWLFHRAISGNLVRQNKTDKPAIELLVRIRAKRATRQQQKQKQKPKRKTKMKELSSETIKETIGKLPKKRFTFAELSVAIEADYDSLKEIIFELLDEEKPWLKQVFAVRSREMQFKKT